MPINTYNTPSQALKNAETLIQAGAASVKLEGNKKEIVRHGLEKKSIDRSSFVERFGKVPKDKLVLDANTKRAIPVKKVLDDYVAIEVTESELQTLLTDGLLDEVKRLYKYKNLNSLNTVGYKEIFDFLDSKITFEQAVENIKTNTRRYAKRQLTWFKKDESIKWFHPAEINEIILYLSEKINHA